MLRNKLKSTGWSKEKKEEVRSNYMFKELLELLHPDNNIQQSLRLLFTDDDSVLYSSNFRNILDLAIKQELMMLTQNIKYLENPNVINRPIAVAKDAATIDNIILALFTQVDMLDKVNTEINRTDLFNIMAGVGKQIEDYKDYDALEEVAKETLSDEEVSKFLSPDELKEWSDTGVPIRGYVNVLRGSDKWARILRSGYMDKNHEVPFVYRTENLEYSLEGEERTRITFGTYDKENHVYQSLWIYADEPSKVHFNLSYTYRTFDNILNAKTVNITSWRTNQKGSEFFDTEKFIKNFYWKPKTKYSKYSPAVPGLDQKFIMKDNNGQDASLNSIIALLTFYNKNQHIFTGDIDKNDTNALEDAIQTLRKQSFHDRDLPINALEFVNMSESLRSKFIDYLDLLDVSTKGKKPINPVKAYIGISQKLLGKHNALIPGKILDMVHEDFSKTYLLTYDDETLSKEQIDLLRSSEGSAGSSNHKFNILSTDLLFTQNTSALRSILSYERLFATFSTLGILNKLYKLEKTTVAETLTDVLEKHLKDNDFKDPIYKELFIKKYYDASTKTLKNIEIFTPNVVSEDMYEKYRRDIFHKTGANVVVAFVDDPYAFEDTVFVDGNAARALGLKEGNKIWLGLYGYKGAAKYDKPSKVSVKEGLKEQYGASFIASASSVVKRSAYGAPLEMAFNVIGRYLGSPDIQKLGDKILVDGSQAHQKELNDLLKTEQITEEALMLLARNKSKVLGAFGDDKHFRSGKVVLSASIDYENDQTYGLVNIFGKTATNDLSNDFDYSNNWFTLIRGKRFDKDGYSVSKQIGNTKSNNEYVAYKNDYDILRGTLYIRLDSEHAADHMQTGVEFDEYGELTYTQTDIKGNPRSGPLFLHQSSTP